jgi:hypothetical protein
MKISLTYDDPSPTPVKEVVITLTVAEARIIRRYHVEGYIDAIEQMDILPRTKGPPPPLKMPRIEIIQEKPKPPEIKEVILTMTRIEAWSLANLYDIISLDNRFPLAFTVLATLKNRLNDANPP